MRVGPPRTVFIGTGAFGLAAFRALAISNDVELVGILTAPARPAGRDQRLVPGPIELAAREAASEPILSPVRLRDPRAVAEVLDLDPALAVLADYGRIVPAALLGLPLRALNLHPSLLPRHRGAAPIPAAILEGDRETGVSIIEMDEGIDHGPIVASERRSLTGLETAPELEADLGARAADLLVRTLPDWIAGRIEPRPQDEGDATMTRPLRRDDGRLDPHHPAATLERQVRALQPWPGTFLETPLGRLIVHRATVAPNEAGDEPSHVFAHGGGLALTTSDGRLVLEEVQLAGRRQMNGETLRRGQPGLVGTSVLLGPAFKVR